MIFDQLPLTYTDFAAVLEYPHTLSTIRNGYVIKADRENEASMISFYNKFAMENATSMTIIESDP